MRRRWIAVSLVTSLIVLGVAICVWNTVIPGSTLSPDWSPDGKMLAFACNYPFLIKGKPWELRDYGVITEAMEICVKSVDGSGFTRLTHNRAYDHYPVWSPDGSRIAFLSANDLVNFESNLHIADVESKQIAELSLPSRSINGKPNWSPDGQWLCFAAGAPSGLQSRNTELYVADLTSNSIHQLTELGGHVELPKWSPDGRLIAFSWEFYEPAHSAMIRLIAADGGDGRTLAEGFQTISDLAWSPNGQALAFIGVRTPTEKALYVVHIADGIIRDLTDQYNISRIHEDVAWTHNGERIAFVGALAGQNPSVLSISQDGKDLREVTEPMSGYQYTWTQDGERLAFVRRDDKRNKHHIWIMDRDSGAAKRMILGLPQ